NEESDARLVILLKREIRHGSWRLADGHVFAVAHHADYFMPGTSGTSKAQPLAYRTLSAQMPSLECLVDDNHSGLVFGVLRPEMPAAQQCDAHSLKIIWSNGVRIYRVVIRGET